MFSAVLILLGAVSLWGQEHNYGFGRPAKQEEMNSVNLTVFPDGRGLPAGQGTAAKGKKIYEVRCVLCHNKDGTGKKDRYPALAGGKGTLTTKKPQKTVGSYWPYATTVWDLINRAMPFNQPRTLPPDDVYSVTAYILFLNGIVTEEFVLNQDTLPKVQMPNRNGFYSQPAYSKTQ